MTKANTKDKKLALGALKLLHSVAKIELSDLEKMTLYIEDVLSSIDYLEDLKEKRLPVEFTKMIKSVRVQALKIKKALPTIVVFQGAFVKTCLSVIDEESPRKSRPSSKASRATTSKTTKKSTTKKQTKGRAK